MARIPFTDTHVHFFDHRIPEHHYDWNALDGPDDPILGDHGMVKSVRYWADDFIAETRFQNVERVIHVECTKRMEDPVLETAWLQRFTDRVGIPHGIVATANLARPDVEDTLDRHCAYPIMRGIRDPDRETFLSDDWRKGYALLEQRDLVCCHSTGIAHAGEARRLVEDFPNIVYCVDHAGFPMARDDEYFKEWSKFIRTMAGAPNTVIKISGLGMVDHQWTVDSIRPWVMECIEAFGTDRAFFATNWVVDKVFSSYGDVLNAYEEIISGFSETEQHALFTENAKRIFRV